MQPQVDVGLTIVADSVKVEAASLAGTNRILPIDALRGVALLLMALHHTAIFSGTYLGAATYNNLPYVPETWLHWISGLVTHIAAPTFWLLGGVSMALFVAGRQRKGDSGWVITCFLLTRALLILLLDLTLGSLLWPDEIGNTHVLISLAISIALMSIVRLLPKHIFITLTIAILANYQLLLSRIAHELSDPQDFWRGLWLTNSLDHFPVLEFPILGWVTIMALGYLLGSQLSSPVFASPRIWIVIGGGLIGLWLIFRRSGTYGDLNPYVTGTHWYYFFEMSKSPPSLTYQVFYIGLSMLILAGLYARVTWLDTAPGKWLITIGQVPLFFFIIHPAIYRVFAFIFSTSGLHLPVMVQAYLGWLLGLGVLIPLSKVYQQARRKYSKSILKYL